LPFKFFSNNSYPSPPHFDDHNPSDPKMGVSQQMNQMSRSLFVSYSADIEDVFFFGMHFQIVLITGSSL
jgi:hypothetical protein